MSSAIEIAAALKAARVEVAASEPGPLGFFGQIDAAFWRTTEGGCSLAWDALHDTACPAAASFGRMAAAAQAGRCDEATLALSARQEGADVQIGQWLDSPARKRSEVLKALDLAILKAEGRAQHA